MRELDDSTLSSRGIKFVDETEREKEKVYDRGNIVSKKDLELASEASLQQTCAILNSSLMGFYYKNFISGELNVFPDHVRDLPIIVKRDKGLIELSEKCHRKMSSFLEEYKSFLKWISREWGVDVEDLSRKTYLKEYWKHGFDEDRKSILNIAKHNKSKIAADPSSRKFQEKLEKEWRASVDKLKPLMEEIQDLENQIDALVFKLYDLNEEEMVTVLDSLETEEEIKEDILEKSEELKE